MSNRYIVAIGVVFDTSTTPARQVDPLSLAARLNEVDAQALAWRQLKELCGYTQDGSHTRVTLIDEGSEIVALSQDDATNERLVMVFREGKSWHAPSFEGAVAQAFKACIGD